MLEISTSIKHKNHNLLNPIVSAMEKHRNYESKSKIFDSIRDFMSSRKTGYYFRISDLTTKINYEPHRKYEADKEESLERYEPKTEFGRELKKLALEFVKKGGKLLSIDELEEEVRLRRGGI